MEVTLVPVDYDPFAEAAPVEATTDSKPKIQLTPVDYDPFADEESYQVMGPNEPIGKPVDTMALSQEQADLDPFALGKSVIKSPETVGLGIVEGLSTELPGMIGDALQYVEPEVLKKTLGDPGKSLSNWAETKSAEWFGTKDDYNSFDRMLNDGAKMFAPSVVPTGVINWGAKIVFGLGKTSKALKAAQVAGDAAKITELTTDLSKAAKWVERISGASTGVLFGASQGQQTLETAEQQAQQLESEGRLKEAAAVRDKAGWASLANATIESTGEYFGTKALGRMLGLGEAAVSARGTSNTIVDFFRTLGVEVGTEMGQQAGEASVEKYTAIRPDAEPLKEALSVIGPVGVMTVLTGGMAKGFELATPKSKARESLLNPGEENITAKEILTGEKETPIEEPVQQVAQATKGQSVADAILNRQTAALNPTEEPLQPVPLTGDEPVPQLVKDQQTGTEAGAAVASDEELNKASIETPSEGLPATIVPTNLTEAQLAKRVKNLQKIAAQGGLNDKQMSNLDTYSARLENMAVKAESPAPVSEVTAEVPKKGTTKTMPSGVDVKYDGEQEMFNKPSMQQYTVYSGTAKGATFLADSHSEADVQAGVDKMVKLREAAEAKKAAAIAPVVSDSSDVVGAEPIKESSPVEFPTGRVEGAYSHTSHRPGGAAKMEEGWFNNSVDELSKELTENTPEENKPLIQAEVDNFKAQYIKRSERRWAARGAAVSVHIAGGSKFNSKQAGRRGSALDRAEADFIDWTKQAKNEIRDKLGVSDVYRDRDLKKQMAQQKGREAADQKEKDLKKVQNKLPIVNTESVGIPITKKEWADTHKDYKSILVSEDGTYRYRSMMRGNGLETVYLSDMKEVAKPHATVSKTAKNEPQAGLPLSGAPQSAPVKAEASPKTKQGGKQPWNMTLDEYKTAINANTKNALSDRKANTEHYNSVKEAHAKGLNVPVENLERYGYGEGDAQSRAFDRYYNNTEQPTHPAPVSPEGDGGAVSGVAKPVETKRQTAEREYKEYVSSLTPEQKAKAGSLITKNPLRPTVKIDKIKAAISAPKALDIAAMSGRAKLPSLKAIVSDAIAAEVEAQETEVEAPKKTIERTKQKAIGQAWDGQKWRPIVETREVTRGKSKGKTEVTFPDGKKKKVEGKSVRMDSQEKYSTTRGLPSLSNISLKEVQWASKGMNSGETHDGSYWVQMPDKSIVTIHKVQSITPNKLSFELSYKRPFKSKQSVKEGELYDVVAGEVAQKGKTFDIEIVNGVGDKYTLIHELKGHIFSDVGIISATDMAKLDRVLEREGKPQTDEGRAQHIEAVIRNRDMTKQYGTFTKRALLRIADAVDSFVNFFHRTARGVIRDLESGKIINKGYKPAQNERGEVGLTGEQTQEGGGGEEIHLDYQDKPLDDEWLIAATKIRSHIENDAEFGSSGHTYGIRIIDTGLDKSYNIAAPIAGDKLEESFEWVDNESTGETLGGTAAFEIEEDSYEQDIIGSLHKALKYFYSLNDSNKIVFLRGDDAGRGGMPEAGARLFEDAEAVAVFDKNGSVISSISDQILPNPTSQPGKVDTSTPPTKLARATTDAPGTDRARRTIAQDVTTAKNLMKGSDLVLKAMRASGLPESAVKRVRVDLKPVIDLRGKDVEKTLAEWADKGQTVSRILGATTLKGMDATAQLSIEQNWATMERTAYHEAFHIAASWVLPTPQYDALMKFYSGNEESAAEAFADYMVGTKVTPAPAGLARQAFNSLRDFFRKLGGFLRGAGFTTPEQTFGDLAGGKFGDTSHGRGGTRVAFRLDAGTGVAIASLSKDEAAENSPINKIINSKYGIDEIDSDWLVENDYYVHGRSGQMELSEDGLVLVTQDMETAKQYGRDGSIHFFKIDRGIKKIDLSSTGTADMDTVVSKAISGNAFESFIDTPLDEETGQPIDTEDMDADDVASLHADVVREAFAPEDIVDSAGGFDNPDFFQWFYDSFGGKYDFVETPDGGVILNAEAIYRISIPYDDGMSYSDDYGKAKIYAGAKVYHKGPFGIQNKRGSVGDDPRKIADTPAFKKWFGKSAVVDMDGEALVVYHGSPDGRFLSDDGTFKSTKERLGMGSAQGVFWFAKDRETAASYADDRRAFDYQNAEPSVTAVYLKIENPLIVNANGAEWREAQRRGKTSTVIDQAIADGHDGIIIKGVKDYYNNNSKSKTTDTYSVFSSTQIKSATGNSGNFDPENPDIRYSKGEATEKIADMAAASKLVIEAMKRSGLNYKAIEKVTIKLKPVIDPAAVAKTQSDQWWQELGVEGGRMLGLTGTNELESVISIALSQSLLKMEKTTYHEAFHVACRWVLHDLQYKNLMKQFNGNEEAAAESFADFMTDSTQPVTGVKGIFGELKDFFSRLGNALRGAGFSIPTDIFGELARGEMQGVMETPRGVGAQAKQDNAMSSDPFHQENKRVRESDRSLWDKAKKLLRRQLSPGGLLPDAVFKQMIERDSQFNAVDQIDVPAIVGVLNDAIKREYGQSFGRLPDSTKNMLHDALSGDVSARIHQGTKTAIVAMRQYIDNMSAEYSDILFKEAAKLAENGNDEASAAKVELINTIAGNIGEYVNRSYRAFDDKKWYKNVPTDVLYAARGYFETQLLDIGVDEELVPNRIEVIINEILKNGTAYDSMEGFIREGKLGSKDLSILKRRKKIAPEIRALLGEYIDPRINFAKTSTKMSRLIWNTRFLDGILAAGEDVFLFKGDDRPPDLVEIAVEGNESYSPLNGYWTFREIDQAFKDVLGKEQMAEWYRWFVRINGGVKVGKTILSPITAVRNWMSAFFFTFANGHFNMTHMGKSIEGFREYFHTKGDAGRIAYLRELKELGVVYDTPYAGEMMQLLADTRVDQDILMSKGKTPFKVAFQYAQKFYQYGDDFWKIIGFENEKGNLINAGMSEQEAKQESAERIRNTYPTYSMVGKFIKSLRRFPLAGTFVSFPAEIIRTQANMIRYVAKDLKSDNPKMRSLAYKRIAGMSISAGMIYGLQALSRAILGISDDEDEAVRKLSAPWNRNSNLFYAGRDTDGLLRYVDLSFIDPYDYFKRPVMALLRDQPWEQKLTDVLYTETLEPFFGTDILAETVFEVCANKRSDTGTEVYKESDLPLNQLADIVDHLRGSLQPGIASMAERAWKAMDGQVTSSGKQYKIKDEAWSLAGVRLTTFDPKTSLYYRTFDFQDAKTEASSITLKTLRDKNDVSDRKIEKAYSSTNKILEAAYKEMSQIVTAARASGMTDKEIGIVLITSGISKTDAVLIMGGQFKNWSPTVQQLKNDAEKITAFGGDKKQILERYQKVKGLSEKANVQKSEEIKADRAEKIIDIFDAGGLSGKAKTQLTDDLNAMSSSTSYSGETAYYEARKLVFDYLETTGARKFATPTKKGNALYYYHQALKFGDVEAAGKYLKKYYALGGEPKTLEQSIKLAHPLASLAADNRFAFRQSLSADQEAKLKQALEWYKNS